MAFDLGCKTANSPCILLCAGTHAREFISSYLLFKEIEYLLNFCLPCRVVVVPIVNPDGIKICAKGASACEDEKTQKFVKKLLLSTQKGLFKANANGVDLNVNFDCDWGCGSQNFFGFPASQNYVGTKPNSEPENVFLTNLVKKINPQCVLTYHSKGEVVFWGFEGQSKKTKKQSRLLLGEICKNTHYKKIFTKNSCGGFKDWCIIKQNISAFTVEVGNDALQHPIGKEQVGKIFEQNKNVVLSLAKVLSSKRFFELEKIDR